MLSDRELKGAPTSMDLDEHPNGFICPITDQIMQHPVMTITGHSFERAAIEEWFENHDTNPATGLVLADKTLTPNINLRKSILEYYEKRPRLDRYVHDKEWLLSRVKELEERLNMGEERKADSALIGASVFPPAPRQPLNNNPPRSGFETKCSIL